MKRNNVKSPLSTLMAFFTLATIWKFTRKMIKKYHLKNDI